MAPEEEWVTDQDILVACKQIDPIIIIRDVIISSMKCWTVNVLVNRQLKDLFSSISTLETKGAPAFSDLVAVIRVLSIISIVLYRGRSHSCLQCVSLSVPPLEGIFMGLKEWPSKGL